MDDDSDALKYGHTNESLTGIVSAMDLSKDDHILAVAGSGDQTFAMLEFGCRVTAVDISQKQLDFMRQRVETLNNRNYESFLKTGGSCDYVDGSGHWGSRGHWISRKSERDDYFYGEDNERLKRIRQNLGGLVIEKRNVLDLAQSAGGFTKIYLSNILLFNSILLFNEGKSRSVAEVLKRTGENLPADGLIYMANHQIVLSRISCTGYDQDILSQVSDRDSDLAINNRLSPELRIDLILSKAARKHENRRFWTPAVYRKVA